MKCMLLMSMVGGSQSRKTQTNQNLPLFPGGSLDERDQELCTTAKPQ